MRSLINKFNEIIQHSTPKQRSYISAFSGFVFFASWAFVANFSHGYFEAVKSALVQGSFSFLVTLVTTSLMEVLYYKLLSENTRFWGSIIIASAVVCGLSWLVNNLAKTPELWATILPGWLITTVFSYSYIFTLSKNKIFN